MQNLVPTVILTPAYKMFPLSKCLGKINVGFWVFFFSLALEDESSVTISYPISSKGTEICSAYSEVLDNICG